MPFVQRVVEPKFLSRVTLHDQDGKPKIKDGELEAVTNYTLSSALRQLASVVLIANDIFEGLNKQLEDVTQRTGRLRTRINALEEKVEGYDPKMVTVPESDLTVFSARTVNYVSSAVLTTGLFTAASRPSPVRRLYESAGPTPLSVMRALDRHRQDGTRASKYFSVTPVLGVRNHRKRRDYFDIETRVPAQVSQLRRWTSLEAMGDVTTELDCTHRITLSDDVDHRLPSPEEQLHAVALKFPSEVVPVDVSGRSFNRMSHLRRSMIHVEYDDSRRRTRHRRPRGKRRNTIAGTDSKELAAIVGDSSEGNLCEGVTPEPEKKSHLESLKEWGLRLLRTGEPTAVKLRERCVRRKWDTEQPTPHSSSGNWSASSESGSTATSHHPRSSISSGSVCQKHGRRPVMVSTSSSVTSESTLTPDDGETCSMYSCDTEGYYTSFHLDSGLKTLREEDPLPALQSTSALSGSRGNTSTLTGDSEYELFGKGSTSTTASSAGTVCTTLLQPPAPNVPERVGSQLSASLPERGVKALHSLGNESSLSVKRETSSLKIEKKNTVRVIDMKKLNEHKSNLTKENVARLKEAEEKKAMITVDVHHSGEGDMGPEKCGDSPDSGHNTCSSPVDSITSPSIDLEMSECSDLEGVDRVERIRVKTVINSSRIPSMCVITPPVSDDEVSLNALRGPVDMGDYVTIADVKSPSTISPIITRDTEYVSLNELPPNDSLERKQRQGARVTLDSEGKVVYSSESLRRRKAVHTTQTFEPGPNVASVSSPVMPRVANIRPVVSNASPALSRRSHSPSSTPVTGSSLTKQSSAQSQSVTAQQRESGGISSQTDFSRKPLSPVSTNRSMSPLLSSAHQKNTVSKSKSQQYFPKSPYGRLSPGMPSKPISPLVSPTHQKSAIARDNSRPLSPSAVYPSHRSLSPKMVVRAKQVARAVSPTPQRGAYVKVQNSEDSNDEDLKNVVKRSDSYRMANDESKPSNLSILAQKQSSVSVVAGPNLLTAIQTARPSKDNYSPEQKISTPVKQSGSVHSNLLSSTPTKSAIGNLDFSTNISPIQPRASTPNPRTAMDLYAIIHESKKKIMKLRERNNSPTLSERISYSQTSSTSLPNSGKESAASPKITLSRANLPISENVLKINSNSRSSTPERCMSQQSSPTHLVKENYENKMDPRLSTPKRISRTASEYSTSDKNTVDRTGRNAPGSGSSTPERNVRIIPEGPHWPKAIPASQVPNLRCSPSSSYDYLNLSPSGHYQKVRSPSPQYVDVNQYPSYPDYRSLPRMGRDGARNSPTHFSTLSPTRQNVFAPREPTTLDRRLLSPQHSTFASDRLGKVQPTSRNDFKQLLLRANWGTAPMSGSAVERLKNRMSPVKTKSWKSDILSSTIPEDCREDDDHSDQLTPERNSGGYGEEGIPRSSALVSQQCKAFDRNRISPTDKNRISPTLETAL